MERRKESVSRLACQARSEKTPKYGVVGPKQRSIRGYLCIMSRESKSAGLAFPQTRSHAFRTASKKKGRERERAEVWGRNKISCLRASSLLHWEAFTGCGNECSGKKFNSLDRRRVRPPSRPSRATLGAEHEESVRDSRAKEVLKERRGEKQREARSPPQNEGRQVPVLPPVDHVQDLSPSNSSSPGEKSRSSSFNQSKVCSWRLGRM